MSAQEHVPPFGVDIWIPGKPVPKARARHGKTRTGKPITYSDPKTKHFELQVGLLAGVAMGASEPFSGPVRLDLDVGMPCPRSWSQKRCEAAWGGEIAHTKKPDLDNLVKSVVDGLNGVAFLDDNQVVALAVRKRYAKTPGVQILVREVHARKAP